MDLKGAPVLGNPNAPITIVEYGDFECPVCRNLHDALRGMLPNYPQVKLVFKDFRSTRSIPGRAPPPSPAAVSTSKPADLLEVFRLCL